MRLEHWIIVAFVALCAGMTGVFLAGNWSPAPEVQRASGLHDLIHKDLELSDAQEQRLEVVERKFAARKKELEARLRAANLALATLLQAPSCAPRTCVPAPYTLLRAPATALDLVCRFLLEQKNHPTHHC